MSCARVTSADAAIDKAAIDAIEISFFIIRYFLALVPSSSSPMPFKRAALRLSTGAARKGSAARPAFIARLFRYTVSRNAEGPNRPGRGSNADHDAAVR